MDKESKSILVVDDDEALCVSLTELLQSEQYTVLCAPTLRDGIFKLKNQRFSCILLDINLGPDSGKEIIDLLRHQKQTRNSETPIVVISGHLERELIGQIAKDVQAALVKPFQPAALLNALRKFVP